MEYETAARRSGRPFLPIYLDYDVDGENIRRVATPECVSDGTGMLVNGELLKAMRSRCELFVFGACEGLRLDVTKLSPLEAAERIQPILLGYIKRMNAK